MCCITLHNFLINTGTPFIENIDAELVEEIRGEFVVDEADGVGPDGGMVQDNGTQAAFTDLLATRAYDRFTRG